MALEKEYEIEPGGESVRQAAGMTEQDEELDGSTNQSIDSATQTMQDSLWRTKKRAGAAMRTVADGIETSTEYFTDRGMVGVVEDMEALIRRYPYPALLIGSSVGFLLARSWRR